MSTDPRHLDDVAARLTDVARWALNADLPALQAQAAGHREPRDLWLEAQHRYRNDPLAHARADLATRLVEAQSPAGAAIRNLEREDYLTGARHMREAIVSAAAVALVLVDLDRSSAEAKLDRVRALAGSLLVSPSPADNGAGRLILEALK